MGTMLKVHLPDIKMYRTSLLLHLQKHRSIRMFPKDDFWTNPKATRKTYTDITPKIELLPIMVDAPSMLGIWYQFATFETQKPLNHNKLRGFLSTRGGT
jgi:hypothetical protein